MHSKSYNIEILINDKADKGTEELFQFFLSRCQTGLEISMKGSEFVFDCVQLLYYKCHKINPNCDGSYRDSHDRIKKKKATINPINKNDNKCLQYAITLNHEKIKNILKEQVTMSMIVPRKVSERFPLQLNTKQLQQFFLNILHKYYNFVLDMSGHFHQNG